MRLMLALAPFCCLLGTPALAEDDEPRGWRPTCSVRHFEEKFERAAIRLGEVDRSDPNFDELNKQVTLAKQRFEDCKSKDYVRIMRALGRRVDPRDFQMTGQRPQ